jgi:hypothetical protein
LTFIVKSDIIPKNFNEGGFFMENTRFILDYYNSVFSYMKLIMDNLDKTNIEKLVVREIFNTFLNRFDNNDIKEIVIYSALFENKINKLDKEEKNNLYNNLYNDYIKEIIINYSNGEMDRVITIYRDLEEKIKVLSGYYGIYGEEGYFYRMSNKKIISK